MGNKTRRTGVVKEKFRNEFLVKLDDEREILAKPSGKLRTSFIGIDKGDKVTVEMKDANSHEGRIVLWQHKHD